MCLRYVREFKDKFVVLAIDGSVINHPNFSNVLVDVAVLRSLNIKIGIVHGAAHEIERIANSTHVTLSDFLGNGVTDEQTLKIAMQASNNMSQKILEGLASVDLKGAITNSLEAHPLGILKGVNHAYSGKVEKVDKSFVQTLLDHNIIPVMPCVAGNGENSFYRINSDQVAVSLATQLQAIKIIYLTSYSGLEEKGQLSLSDNIRKYIPTMPDFGSPISLRHLISQSSGLHDFWVLKELAGWSGQDVFSQEEKIWRNLRKGSSHQNHQLKKIP